MPAVRSKEEGTFLASQARGPDAGTSRGGVEARAQPKAERAGGRAALQPRKDDGKIPSSRARSVAERAK